ncbi:hypothetical protein [Glycomyces algeriensis]|uniref:Uncharacterized protein n=1 Tax=Glycomyces algeriensis TaxID=256037 RepID=A0A9W6LHR9_9ACTN|nr:hypothetical protein [Glycomyces algeriensis]MDA1368862.1 hypothetical protein [Glycomyces algeriensis]MDR7350878.1 hypothetical protein [Glycomyces algeriensis]GLI43590.1 hypothetical protein GALLR39Z86_34400 [Glycomyces algeriensis]
MTDLRLVKLFAWTIGVLTLLWMLTECLGGVDETDPGYQDLDRDAEQIAADCEHAWQAFDLAAEADGENVDGVLDQIDTIGTGIVDPNLKSLTSGFAVRVQEMVASVPEGDADALEEAQAAFRDDASLDLAMRCPLR